MEDNIINVPVDIKGINCIIPKGLIETYLISRKKQAITTFDLRTKRMKYLGEEFIDYPMYSSYSKTHISIGLPAILLLHKRNKNIKLKFNSVIPENRNRILEKWYIPEGIKSAPKFEVNGKSRYYFFEALEKCIYNQFGSIKLATGTGKTEIELTLAHNQANIIGSGLLIVPTVSIKDQTIKRAKSYNIDVIEYKDVCDLLDKGQDLNSIPKIIIGLPLSISNDIESKKHVELVNSIKWVIGDESHRFGCDTWNKLILSLPSVTRCHGFSALPVDPDTKQCKSFADMDYKDALTISATGDIIYEKTAKQLKDFLNLPILINFHYQWRNYDASIRNLLDWNKLYKEMLLNNERNSTISKVFETVSTYNYNSVSYVSRKVQGENILEGCNEKTLCWFGGDVFLVKENNKIIKLSKFKQEDLKQCFGEKYNSVIMTSHGIEGLDFSCPLTALILTEGKSERQGLQKVGRIVRPADVKSIIINFCDDNVKILNSQARSRCDNAVREFDCSHVDVYSLEQLNNLLKKINQKVETPATV